MKKYILLLILIFPFSLQADSLEQMEESATEYLTEFEKKLRSADLAMLYLTEDKDYPWDDHHCPYYDYDFDSNPELPIEELATIDRFDYAQSLLIDVAIFGHTIATHSDPNEMIERLKAIYGDSEEEDVIYTSEFAYANWLVFAQSPEQYLRLFWSKTIATDISNFTSDYE